MLFFDNLIHSLVEVPQVPQSLEDLMKVTRCVSLATVGAMFVLGVVGCSGNTHSVPAPSQNQEQTIKPKPVKPKPSIQQAVLREDKDVRNLHLEKPPGDNMDVLVACKVTNHSSQVSDYVIETETVYSQPNWGDKRIATIHVNYVPPGATVPCQSESLLESFDLDGWRVLPIRIDRTPTGVKDTDEDKSLDSISLNADGTQVTYTVTNYVQHRSKYLVKYEIRGANNIIAYRSSFITKQIDYLQSETGTFSLPHKIVRKLWDSLQNGRTMSDVTIKGQDIDRIPRY